MIMSGWATAGIRRSNSNTAGPDAANSKFSCFFDTASEVTGPRGEPGARLAYAK